LTVLPQAIEAMRPSDIGELMVMDAYNAGQRLYVLLQRGKVEKPDKKRGAYRITQEEQKYLDNPPPKPPEKMTKRGDESGAKRGDKRGDKSGDKSGGVKIVEKTAEKVGEENAEKVDEKDYGKGGRRGPLTG